MKAFFKEFKEFITKGNVMSMAVGIIIGGAFTAIVTAVVENLITPLIGLICGGVDVTDQLVVTVGNTTFGFGAVINAIITFLMTAFVLFLILKGVNKLTEEAAKLKKKEEEEAAAAPEPDPEPTKEEILLTEIRDLLKK